MSSKSHDTGLSCLVFSPPKTEANIKLNEFTEEEFKRSPMLTHLILSAFRTCDNVKVPKIINF